MLAIPCINNVPMFHTWLNYNYVSFHLWSKYLHCFWLSDCSWRPHGPSKHRHHWPSTTASHPRRCKSSATLLWKPQILHLYFLFSWAGIAQSVQRLTTGWMVQGLNLSGGKIFRTSPDRPWGPPGLLHNGYCAFPGGKVARAWCWPPTPIQHRG